MEAEDVKIIKGGFWCDKDLSECKDSLLFNSDVSIAEYTATDENGNTMNLWLTVKGDVDISRIDGEKRFRSVSEYDDELIADIKSGEVYNQSKYAISLNNWFEVIYTLTDDDGHDIYEDGIVYDGGDISKMTKKELEADLREMARNLIADAYDNGDFKIKEHSCRATAKGDKSKETKKKEGVDR